VADVLGIKEASKLLGISRQQVWRYVRSGRLPARKIGDAWIITLGMVQKMKAWREMRAKQEELPFGRKKRQERKV
jgi:excisionase family DNA binding protein